MESKKSVDPKIVDYYINPELVVESKAIDAYCTDIDFYNMGSDVVTVNGRIILPGESWGISGFPFERNTTAFNAVFQTTSNPMLYVTRRLYKGIQYR